ncbi:MAG: hypothetical protein ACYSSP_11725 [Planctomycetota bacterium]
MSPLFGFNQKQDVAVTEENGNFTEDEQIKGLSNLYTPEEDINSSSVRDVAKVLLEMEFGKCIVRMPVRISLRF